MDLFFLVKRSFDANGSLVIIASLLVPFFVAWLLSVYENRLLYYFSEGQQVLTKGNIVGSVISATVVPYLLASFGLLIVSSIFGDEIGVATLEDGQIPYPSSSQAMVYIPLTLVVSIVSVALIHRRIVSRKLPETPSVQRLLNRWVVMLAIVSQVLILGFLWALLFLFPAEANTQIN